MDAEEIRVLLLELPHVIETMQWGDNLVFWVGDKTVGGKMFAVVNLDAGAGMLKHGVASFASGKERAAELLEIDGIFPAPYLARAGWVAVERWGVLRRTEWDAELRAAHGWVLGRLPVKVRKVLISAEEIITPGALAKGMPD